jgi:hypothetical protein
VGLDAAQCRRPSISGVASTTRALPRSRSKRPTLSAVSSLGRSPE